MGGGIAHAAHRTHPHLTSSALQSGIRIRYGRENLSHEELEPVGWTLGTLLWLKSEGVSKVE